MIRQYSAKQLQNQKGSFMASSCFSVSFEGSRENHSAGWSASGKSQSAKVFPISVKTVAHCFALPKRPLGASEAFSAPTGAACD
jgi:hypothetical protein